MNEQLSVIITVAIVFYGIYQTIKLIMDFLLRRKIVKMGHIEKAGIMDPVAESTEDKRFPTLKYGLVAFFGGIGLILIDVMGRAGGGLWLQREHGALMIGVELVFIAAGFLIYFFYVNRKP
jgi:hypothetical protein